MRYLKIILLITFLICSQHISAKNQLGLWYSGANPDYKPYPTEHGLAISLESQLDNKFFVRLKHDTTEFLGSGPEVGGEQFNSWTEVGVGYALNDWLKGLYTYVSYTSVDGESETIDGPGVHLGYQWQWNKQWSSRIQVGHLDTEIDDIQLEGQLNYQFADSFQLSIALQDHSDWDYTFYKVGVLYRF